MKRQVRNNVFETNSSSMHSICISKKPVITDDINGKFVYFQPGEFGWEFEKYDDLEDKASYLYEAITDLYRDEKECSDVLNRLYETLGKYGVSCKFKAKKKDKYGFTEGYIDHVDQTAEFLKAVLHSENRLLRFLFGDSFILTGNDNCYEDEVPQYNVPESEYEIYYKGN